MANQQIVYVHQGQQSPGVKGKENDGCRAMIVIPVRAQNLVEMEVRECKVDGALRSKRPVCILAECVAWLISVAVSSATTES